MIEDANKQISPETYIQERVKQYQAWYDRKAVSCKALYLRMRAVSVFAGVMVPVLVNLDFRPHLLGYEINVVKILVSVLSLTVAVCVSLEGVFHYREQWKNYRSTEQFLGHEQFLFLTKVGRYKDISQEQAFRLLVERVEDAIENENAATLNVLTVASENSERRR